MCFLPVEVFGNLSCRRCTQHQQVGTLGQGKCYNCCNRGSGGPKCVVLLVLSFVVVLSVRRPNRALRLLRANLPRFLFLRAALGLGPWILSLDCPCAAHSTQFIPALIGSQKWFALCLVSWGKENCQQQAPLTSFSRLLCDNMGFRTM